MTTGPHDNKPLHLAPDTLAERLIDFEVTNNSVITMDFSAGQLQQKVTDVEWTGLLKLARYINIRLARIQVKEDSRRRRWMAVVEGRGGEVETLQLGPPEPFVIQRIEPATPDLQPEPPEPQVEKASPRPMITATVPLRRPRVRTAAEIAGWLAAGSAVQFAIFYSLASVSPVFPIIGAVTFGALAGAAIGKLASYFVSQPNEIVRSAAEWLTTSQFRNANLGAFLALYVVFLRPALRETLVAGPMLEWSGLLLISFYILWRTWAAVTAATADERAAKANAESIAAAPDSHIEFVDEIINVPDIIWERHKQVVDSVPDRFARRAVEVERQYIEGINGTAFVLRVLTAMWNSGAGFTSINDMASTLIEGWRSGIQTPRESERRLKTANTAKSMLQQVLDAGDLMSEPISVTRSQLAESARNFVVTGRKSAFFSTVAIGNLQIGASDVGLAQRLSRLWLYQSPPSLLRIFRLSTAVRDRQMVANQQIESLEPELKAQSSGTPHGHTAG